MLEIGEKDELKQLGEKIIQCFGFSLSEWQVVLPCVKVPKELTEMEAHGVIEKYINDWVAPLKLL